MGEEDEEKQDGNKKEEDWDEEKEKEEKDWEEDKNKKEEDLDGDKEENGDEDKKMRIEIMIRRKMGMGMIITGRWG